MTRLVPLLVAVLAAPAPALAADPVPAPSWAETFKREGGWSGGVLLRPDGDVLLCEQQRVVRLSARGEERASREVCAVALDSQPALTGDGTVLLPCDDGVWAVTPELDDQKRIFEGKARWITAGAGHVAIVLEGGIRVLQVASGRLVDEVTLPGVLPHATLTADGATLFYGDPARGLVARTLATQEERVALETGDAPPDALAISADGRRAVLRLDRALAVFDLATGERRDCPSGTWEKVVALAGDDLLFAGGSDGLRVCEARKRRARQNRTLLHTRLSNVYGLAVSPDGGTVCGGDASGRVSCAVRAPDPTGPEPLFKQEARETGLGVGLWGGEEVGLRLAPGKDAVVGPYAGMQLGVLPLRLPVGDESVVALGAGVRWGWGHMWQVSGLVRLSVGSPEPGSPSAYLQAGPLLMRHQAGMDLEAGVDVAFAALWARALWEPNHDGTHSWTFATGVRVSLAAVVGALIVVTTIGEVFDRLLR